MADPKLDNFLKQWAEHEALGDPGKDCPPVSVLWRHVTELKPLSDYDGHVRKCLRCRKRLDFIHRELEAPLPALIADKAAPQGVAPQGVAPQGVASQGAAGFSLRDLPSGKSAPPRRIPPLWLTAALAAAACLTLLVLNWPQEPAGSGGFDGRVAEYLDSAGSAARPIFRGPNDAPTRAPSDSDGWLQALLDDEQAAEALSDLGAGEQILLQERAKGRIVISDGRPTIAPNAVLEPAKHEMLTRRLKEDDDACERIVDALIRHVPDASEDDRAELRRALDRWRAKEVFATEGE